VARLRLLLAALFPGLLETVKDNNCDGIPFAVTVRRGAEEVHASCNLCDAFRYVGPGPAYPGTLSDRIERESDSRPVPGVFRLGLLLFEMVATIIHLDGH
jgi:hypothetical protein